MSCGRAAPLANLDLAEPRRGPWQNLPLNTLLLEESANFVPSFWHCFQEVILWINLGV
nr:MAG: hypothetical protein [Microvirus sp.]